MKRRITVLAGDGVGPQVVEEAVKVLKKVAKRFGHEFSFKEGLIGAAAIASQGLPLQEKTIELCKKADAVLFGAIGDPKYDNDPQVKVRPEQGLLKLRKELGLYANLRPVKVYPQLADVSPLKVEKVDPPAGGVDLVVVRELTGGIYFGEHRRVKGDKGNKADRAIDSSEYTREEIERVARVAFEFALRRRKNVVSVDKANVLETSRLWRETVTEIGRKYPTVALTHMFVDNAAMQLIKRPSDFDVVLTENMFGDILSDEASMIVGSIGMLPSASIGDTSPSPSPTRRGGKRFFGLYEPIHGAYNKGAGKNIANPIGTILSTAMMLRISFGMEEEAKVVEQAVANVIKNGWRTRDIATKNTISKRTLGTREMGEKIMNVI